MKDQTLPSLLKFADRLTVASMFALAIFALWLWFFLDTLEDDPNSGVTADSWRTLGQFACIGMWVWALLHAAWAAFLISIKPKTNTRLPQSVLLFFSGVIPVFLGGVGLITGGTIFEMLHHLGEYWSLMGYVWAIGILWVCAAWVRASVAARQLGEEQENGPA